MGTGIKIQENVLNLLKRVGLNQYESRIYVSLLANGSSTAGELSELSNVPRSRVYDVLTSLENKGFAIVQVGRPVKYVSVQADDAVQHIKARLEEDFKSQLGVYDSLGSDLTTHLDVFKSEKHGLDDSSEVVGIIRGKVNVYTHMKQLFQNSKKDVIKITNHDGLTRLEKHCNSAIKSASKRGVKIRIATTSHPEKPELIHKFIDIKKVSTPAGRFFVRDGKEALLVTTPDDAPQDVALWVKSPYLSTCLTNLFEEAWTRGESVTF